MDINTARIVEHTIRKEKFFLEKYRKERERREGPPLGSLTTKLPARGPGKGQSAALNFLDQSLGIVVNPHSSEREGRAPADAKPAPTPRQLLLYGVSREGEGRVAYLRVKASRSGPHERFGCPQTESHEVGWASNLMAVQPGSAFARRPTVQSQFFRKMGIPWHGRQPAQN